MESIARSINFKIFIYILISWNLLDLSYSKVNGEIFKNNSIDEIDEIDEIDFETVLNQNSVQFHDYENPKTLFDDFFGISNQVNESKFNTNFQDLTLQIDSMNIRQLYIEKLLEMTKKNEKTKDNKLNWSFFNKKI